MLSRGYSSPQNIKCRARKKGQLPGVLSYDCCSLALSLTCRKASMCRNLTSRDQLWLKQTSTAIDKAFFVKMAAAHITTRSILSSFLPRFSQPTISKASRFTTLYSRQLSTPLLPSLSLAIPSAISLNIPGLIEGLWESILRAVPKKKTSHSKSRSRRLAGKGLKDVTNLVKCPGCGSVKRAHVLCPYCVAGKIFTD